MRKGETKYPLLKDEAYLRKRYIEEKKPLEAIAKEVGCTRATVRDALLSFGISTRSVSEAKKKGSGYPQLNDHDWLYQRYWLEKRTVGQIAKEAGCGGFGTVVKALIRLNIPVRTKSEGMKGIKRSKRTKLKMSEARKKQSPSLYDKDLLRRKYGEGLCFQEIAEEIGCNKLSVYRAFKRFAIPTRTPSELMKKRWKKEDFRKHMMKVINAHPNKLEIEAGTILDELMPNEFGYNGDYSLGVSIGSLIPDFVNLKDKKIVIEVFGDLYHDEKEMKRCFGRDIPWEKTEFGRKAVYSQYGYKCIVLWEKDLKGKNGKSYVQSVLESEEVI